jgi:peptidoglycan pentaglycine glycine transferase (the first glycine)
MPILSGDQWESYLAQVPSAHILQSRGWGDFKAEFGWTSVRIQSGKGAAQVLYRKLPFGFSLAYMPKVAPDVNLHDLVFEVDLICRQRHSVFLIIEPDTWEPLSEQLSAELDGLGQRQSPVQPWRTLLIDLSGGEEKILARMKQKTRYNIHLAERKGVTVRSMDDLGGFYEMIQETGRRDGFSVHSRKYYETVYNIFKSQDQALLLQAEFEGRPLAGLMAFAQGRRAWYFYGASNDEERSRMPTYLLQWEAMRWAIHRGCCEYDLWGVPDEEESVLEEEFSTRSDGLWGVYRFKRGFGGKLVRSAGAWHRVYNPLLYQLYRWKVSKASLNG